MKLQERKIHREAEIKATRSSGKGGQNVNKVSTKVEVRLNIANSSLLTEEEKQLLAVKLEKKLTADGWLVITEQGSRSQLENKQVAIARLYSILEKCFVKTKKRKPTKPSKSSKEKRLKTKKLRSETKKNRRPDF
jgi:ribosome-associated protein